MTTIQIVETAIAVAVYLIIKILVDRNIHRMAAKNLAAKTRSRIVKKAINLMLLLILITIIFSIFGVNQSELLVFIGSVLTVMGIALFAQWSILANITSGIIIFFDHSVKLNDTLTILDKDYEIEGKIVDIGLFFIIVQTSDNEQITIPNSLFFNKMIKRKGNV